MTTVHATRKTCASLLVSMDVHPRMQILRRSQIAVTMDIYSEVASDSTLRALKALGGSKATEHHHPWHRCCILLLFSGLWRFL
jgi:hypothetical protein